MTAPLVVRLHDDVVVGPVVVRAGRVLRLAPAARQMLADREVEVASDATRALAERLLDLDLARPVGTPPQHLSDVTVVVPVRDNASGVERLLASLGGAVSVVVVDDASSDPGSLPRITARHGADLLRLARNVGPSAARNAGLRRVSTSLVAFVDSDVVVDAAALTALLADLVDPRVAVVAPRVRTRGGRRWFERYEDAHGSLDLGDVATSVRVGSAVAYVPSACLVARVGALESGFDESLRSGEDVDLVWRLLAAGHRVRYRADVHVWHDARATVRGWLGRKAFYGTSAAQLARSHGAAVAPAVLGPASTALALAAVAQRRWSAPAVLALLVRSWLRTSRDLPDSTPAQRAEIVAFGARVTARQTSGLVLRHWWPVTAVLALRSRRTRRLVLVASVVDAIVAARGTDLDPARTGVARRLDDLSYGAGVWWGAARERSIRCLLPAWVRDRA